MRVKTSRREAVAATDSSAGVPLMVLAMFIVPVMDAVAKHLSATLPVFEIAWARYTFHLLALLPWVLTRHGLHALWPPQPLWQAARGALLLGTTLFFFGAITIIPIPDALALIFIAPILVTALSPWLLGETVFAGQWFAVVTGFLGACIVLAPNGGAFGRGGVLALCASVCYALYLMVTRKISGSAPLSVTILHTALVGAFAMIAWQCLTPNAWVAPVDTTDAALLVAVGLLAALGHGLIVAALSRGGAARLAPYTYAEIIAATIISLIAFGYFPSPRTWLGIAVIVASAAYLSVRGRRRIRVR